MPQYYAAADVFVLIFYNEGMSVALLEALASGLPVVVTETGGTTELVEDNGFIVPWADPVALAEVLERFLCEPVLIKQMGQSSLEIAKQFSWKASAIAYIDLCQELLEN
jgi:glycosyltransferase involved in cell wall biosynthesis